MINKLIKNETPYLGELKLMFDKNPDWIGRTVLNKVHLNLGFTKLVSRIKPNTTMNGWEVDLDKIKLIESYTGGKIGEYWVDGREPKDEFTLNNSFLHPDGRYIGDIRDGWWFYKNKMIVTDKKPSGVAMKLKTRDSVVSTIIYEENKNGWFDRVVESGNIEGFYGYTHRGGSLFKIGDKIFDENWIPKLNEIKTSWLDDYEQYTGEKIESLSDNNLQIRIVGVIPFTERGSEIIKTWEEAEQSAINMSNYLS
jgi:hypothetical protein